MNVKKHVLCAGILFSVFSVCAQEDLLHRMSSLHERLTQDLRWIDVYVLRPLQKRIGGEVYRDSQKSRVARDIFSLKVAIQKTDFELGFSFFIYLVPPGNEKDGMDLLRYLSAFHSVVLECVEWLVDNESPLDIPLDLDNIRVDDMPDSLQELEDLFEQNKIRTMVLLEKLERIVSSEKKKIGFWSIVSQYTIKSKLFQVAGVSLAALCIAYMISEIKKNKESEESFSMRYRNRLAGKEVTPENLYALASKPPAEVEEKLSQWFEDNRDAWNIFVRQDGPLSAIGRKYLFARCLAEEKNLKTFPSHGNFIFELPDSPEWIVKISGPANRAQLQIADQNLPYGDLQNVDTTKLVKTYQTASRVFHGLKVKEAIEKYGLTKIEVVEDYLWSPEKSCEDEKSVAVEKFLKDIVLLEKIAPEKLDELLTEETVRQIIFAAKYAGLWNVTKDNVAVNTQTGKIVFFDTEQPNSVKVSQMFNKDKARYGHSINTGVQTLYQALPKGSKARDRVENCAKKDKEIMGAYNVKDLLSLFEKNKEVDSEH